MRRSLFAGHAFAPHTGSRPELTCSQNCEIGAIARPATAFAVPAMDLPRQMRAFFKRDGPGPSGYKTDLQLAAENFFGCDERNFSPSTTVFSIGICHLLQRRTQKRRTQT